MVIYANRSSDMMLIILGGALWNEKLLANLVVEHPKLVLVNTKVQIRKIAWSAVKSLHMLVLGANLPATVVVLKKRQISFAQTDTTSAIPVMD